MARNRRKPDEGGGPSNGWMVTFSDCMTLLLCFFVMLVTFSSFDNVARERFSGAFGNLAMDSIFPIRRSPTESVVEPVDYPIDHAKEGSEKPTDEDLKHFQNPADRELVLDADAHRDRRAVYIPSDRLFLGRGGVLSPAGRLYLKPIGAFLRTMPCRVIVGECNSAAGVGDATPAGTAERAYAVLRYFSREAGVPSRRLNLSAAPAPAPPRFADQPVMEIRMLSSEATR